MVAMDQYYSNLSAMEGIIRNWDPVKKIVEPSVTVKTKAPRSAKSKDTGRDAVSNIQTDVNKFQLWYVKASDPWQNCIYDMVVAQMGENVLAKHALQAERTPKPNLTSELYSVLTSRSVQKRDRQVLGDAYQLVSITPAPDILSVSGSTQVTDLTVSENRAGTRRTNRRQKRGSSSKTDDQSLVTATMENTNTSNASFTEGLLEEPLKPRWILQPNETQTFKVRFQPKETGLYDEIYAVTIADGNNVTYEVNINGVADIPRLDMNPESIFDKVMDTTVNTSDPAYFLDRQIYDFGSILVLPKDRRPHWRETEFKFRNVSRAEAEVCFSLSENNDNCFSIQTESMLILPGEHGVLILSATTTKLGTNSGSLYLCVKNNPKAEVIRFQSEGTKLDIELDQKQISFGSILLYRREFQTLTIRNKNGIEISWSLEPEESLDPQITFAPNRNAIKPWDEQKIEFCYHGVNIGIIKTQTMIFKAFLYENDDPIFTEVVRLSGQTYDVSVDIDHANPIDLKRIKVNVPSSGLFTMRNRGNYEVQFVIIMKTKEELAKLNLPINLRKNLEVLPSSGTILPNSERVVEVVIVTKTELTLREAQILKCHLVDNNKETTIVAEIPLAVSFDAYYTRFRVYPYPSVDFGTMALCTEKTMYLNIENTGKFTLRYTIRISRSHPSMLYRNQMSNEGSRKKKSLTARTTASKKSKKSVKLKKTEIKAQNKPEQLIVGPMTISKTEGDVGVGQTESIAVTCRPEFVGSQDEKIMVLVNDTSPEDSNGKEITLLVLSLVPSVDFEDFDSMFQENHVVDYIQDSDCPKEIGSHTVFARQETCLYFRYVSVTTTHTTCFKLYNRNIVPANVEVLFIPDSRTLKTAKSDTFVVEPRSEEVLPSSYKTFAVSFTPATIETFHGTLEVTILLPPHLADEKLFIKVIGESCVPEVVITEPMHGKRENITLNFARTLVNETGSKQFALENVGFIKAKVIIEIDEDQDSVFTFEIAPETKDLLRIVDSNCYEPNDRCTVVRLKPGNVARFKVRFSPTDISRYTGKIRVFIVDNPYENMAINLEGESYMEPIILEGLEFEETKRRSKEENQASMHKGRKLSSRQASMASVRPSSTFAASLSYVLDYGLCHVSKMYTQMFKITNKSADRWFRFQWNAHPNIVFVPSIGHIKFQTCKEIVATFLASEPVNYSNTRIECIVCEILVTQPNDDTAWDDRQTEVRWEILHPDLLEQPKETKTLTKKIVQPAPEPQTDIVPGTGKCIQVLLNATVAFTEYSCPIQEIHFKDTLMFQTRGYRFTVSNLGLVNTQYVWKISMDEQYPTRYMGDSPNATCRPRTAENSRSRPNSRSFRGIFSATSEQPRHRNDDGTGKNGGDCGNLFTRRCTPALSDTFELKPPSTRPSDLFSSTAGLSERTTDSWLEGDDMPFSIYPEEGSIPPRESVEFTLKFSPVDVFYYKAYLKCGLENLRPEQSDLSILVTARSLLPYCHFDVEDSDYVTSGRRDPTRPSPLGSVAEDPTLWQNIRVIEFKVVGVGETHVKNFHLINPTMDNYCFTWKDQTCRTVDEISNFHCTVPEGIAERGKQTDLAFTFLAENVGVYESFWLFSIKRYNLECHFLVVGIVTEPSVHLLTVHVKLKPTILGYTVHDSIRLLNDESFDIPFRILEESLYSEGKYQKLTVTPMTGILASKTEQSLWVEYHPTQLGEFHFSIQCAVRLMKSSLTVFVAASVYEIVSSVSYSIATGKIVQPYTDKENVVDLGKLILKVPINVKFDIGNSGKTTFYYAWNLGMTPEISCRNAYNLEMHQKQGYVSSKSRSICNLTVTAFQRTVIKNHCVTLEIANGPTYRFLLNATSKKIAVQFSFDRYDFGPCYVQQTNGITYRTELCVTNSEDVPVIVECNFEEQPHLSVDLNAISEALSARSTIVIPIVFRPLKETKYHEYLVFKLNSVYEKKIPITGEGIPYKIRLVNPRDKLIDVGGVPVAKSVVRKVPVVNEGRSPVDVKFDLIKNLSAYGAYRERERSLSVKQTEEYILQMEKASVVETKRSWTLDTQLQTGEPRLSDVLTIEPSSNIILRPNKRIDVVMRFKPTARMKNFAGKVGLQTSSVILPLFMVHGSCVGAEFQLNRTHFSFGTVVEGCTRKSKVVLMNIGDLGARFKWNTSKLPADFTINPASGYCSPGMDVNFVIKFQPSQQRSLIEGVAIIEIEKYTPLSIKITGGCCTLPEPMETVFFTSVVRQQETQAINVTNSANLTWSLKPEVTGDYFFVDNALHVPAKGFGSCMVTYAPLVMNTEDTRHTGTLLIKLPDEGTPLIYSLRGSSLPPEVLAKIHRKFPAKTKYTELLPVHNWLDKQQRFSCKIEPVKPSSVKLNHIPVFDFSGNDSIDIPSNSHRDYRAVFYSYEEYNFHFKVTFTNEDNEYQFYEIEYDVTKPEVLETIKLSTSVRSQVCHCLKLDNPLKGDAITYTTDCQEPFIIIRDLPKTVRPLSHEHITIQYCPMLQTEETVVLLDIYCQELGHFPYELRLKAAPAVPEKVTRVSAILGAACTFPLFVINYTKRNAQFTIQIDNDCFTSRRQIEIAEFSNGKIEVTYEPCCIETITAKLTASSKTAGNFVFPLIGACFLPKPTGPYIITQKSSISLSFKNVFKDTKTFNFFVDVPAIFATEIQSATLDPKQSIDIKVSILENKEEEFMEEKYPVTGKLLIYCTDNNLSNINWIYYLRGVSE
ncbi:PREDICTED: hydrocephalus-inducing protein-like [Dufourea novaeangliae]|uniref:hydrocephalus-inducing protein-like n=1 Tax=Dufourea novaeangliae TaxID=178035 RepID=UPI000767B98A|nr:PREDICTED: hydrocephalus-inducing protein-like [Dufourea novaeangliae]